MGIMALEGFAAGFMDGLLRTPAPDTPSSKSATDTPVRSDPATQFLVATARGDRVAFSRLYACTAPRLLAVALRILRDRGSAEDVLQESFITIWERAAVFSPERSSAMTWMTTIVRNRCLDRVRAPRREMSADDDADGVSRIDREAAPGNTPEEAHQLSEDARDVNAALKVLPGHYRQALMLAYGQGCSHTEVAATLGVPVGTAKSWVRRGLADLRDAFGRTSSAR